MLSKEDGLIDWTHRAVDIDRLVRGVTPWPGAQTTLRGTPLKILKAHAEPGPDAEPHVVLQADRHGLLVATGEGNLRITHLQLQGKRPWTSPPFLTGIPSSPAKPSAADMDGRRAAFEALTAFRQRDAYLNLVTEALFERANIDPRDRRLATAIASGVLRHRSLIDFYIAGSSKIPPEKLEPAVLDALRIGVFQIRYLDRVPDSAAVNETVKLVPKRAKGFVNAVLKNLAQKKIVGWRRGAVGGAFISSRLARG
ncbi:MAG: hypothetical protein M5R36_13985 [Deltaproteobacteria bacterium]|nr:hypothetical protein [Deltaproteobacteria bacterium]